MTQYFSDVFERQGRLFIKVSVPVPMTLFEGIVPTCGNLNVGGWPKIDGTDSDEIRGALSGLRSLDRDDIARAIRNGWMNI